MGLFKRFSNDSNEYVIFSEYKRKLELLLNEDSFISKKCYLSIYNEINEVFNKLMLMKDENVLLAWCKNNRTDYVEFCGLLGYYASTEYKVKLHNTNFVNEHLSLDKEYLDNVLIKDDPNIRLDEEQRRVVLSDEDYTLVIAGAGSGKTTTIEAKVKYLIDKKNVDPSRILIVSFTRKATKELADRCKRLGLPVNISTFHSIANTIIRNNDNEKYNVVSSEVMFSVIKKYLINNVNDESFVKNILLFFASYLEVPRGEGDLSLLINELSKNDCTTMRSDIVDTVNNYKELQEKNKRTIKSEKVRSTEECRIANFFFINGIDYEYEPVYPYGFRDTIKPYCPDFVIRQNDKEIYIEHFGISEDGKNGRFSDEELELYKKHVNDKILLHKKHGTKLIYTFSKYKDGKDTITHLKEELKRAGISFEQKNNKEIYSAIVKNIEDKYFNKFVQLVCVFISRFKTNNFSASKFDEWKITVNDERTKLFISICYQCYLAYMTELKAKKCIDFEDMINNAAGIIQDKIDNNEKLPYDYIFIDEYQDISLQRFDLCERLSKCSDAKIVAVGDDWQSIFKFSGSKIELFTKFEEMMGYADVLRITKTYRNSQELIDIAGGFVMSNDEQLKKDLKSDKSIKNPVLLMSYNDRYDKELSDTPIERMCKAIEKSLDLIVRTSGENSSVLLIGRYGFEGYQLGKQGKFFSFYNNNIGSVKYPNLKLTYLTAHSSKGLGYDNVIIINGKDAILGFPSKIVDDPVMKLVIKDTEVVDYAEERRLFYVALTRTKNRVFVITPVYKPSQFILEIIDKFKNILISGDKLSPIKQVGTSIKCPCCGYPLQVRGNRRIAETTRLWICSNDPEICGFVTNDLKGGKMSISKCPNCVDGYLIVKNRKDNKDSDFRILGCSNYKADGTGCNTMMLPSNYTQDREEVDILFYNDSIDIHNVYVCGMRFIQLVNVIIEVAKRYENLSFSFGSRILFSILSGEETTLIKNFKMNKNKWFGVVISDDRDKFYAVLKALKEAKVIDINYNNYGKITVLKDKLDVNDYKIVYSLIKI